MKRPRVSRVIAGFGGIVGQVGVLLVTDPDVGDPVTGVAREIGSA